MRSPVTLVGYFVPSLGRLVPLLALLLLAGQAIAGQVFIDEGRGNVAVQFPDSYDPAIPAPLIVALHAYHSGGGSAITQYLQLTQIQEDAGFIYMAPSGTLDCCGNRFWSVNHICCDGLCACEPTNVDDSGYLRALIEATELALNVDPTRIYIVGYSNGAMMADRMACDHADKIAAIVGVDGSMAGDMPQCQPSNPVHVLHIGAEWGGYFPATVACSTQGPCLNSGDDVYSFPGVEAGVLAWREMNGCDAVPDLSQPPFELDDCSPFDPDTTVTRYVDACNPGGSAEVWFMQGSDHGICFNDTFKFRVIDYLYQHPKPDCNRNGGILMDTDDDGSPDTCAAIRFLRGDCNGDGKANIVDVSCTLNWLFGAVAKPGCIAAVNTNGDDKVDIADPVSLLNFLFGGGPSVVAPFPDCGPGTLAADAELGCANPANCQ